ncbi:MAG: HEAT repeat domain-containing protein, partial [Polyangiaceae bacterium]|nr:HEAT repeat domain-containing protein [Polyangiaceae bacterium]
RALAKIRANEVLDFFRDRLDEAEEGDRLAIIDALSLPPTFENGGQALLEKFMDKASGLLRLAAALSTSRASSSSAQSAQQADRVLRDFAQNGTSYERRRALAALLLDTKQNQEILIKATESSDNSVKVLALSRLAQVSRDPQPQLDALLKMAKDNSEIGLSARMALGARGDQRVYPLLVQQSQSTSPSHRRLAAIALLKLKTFAPLGPLIVDADPQVRRQVACRIRQGS